MRLIVFVLVERLVKKRCRLDRSVKLLFPRNTDNSKALEIADVLDQASI